MATGGGEIFDRLRTAGTGVDGPTVPGQAQRDGPPHAARATGYEHGPATRWGSSGAGFDSIGCVSARGS